MNHFNKIFLKGLITLLPIAVTIYILYSAVIILENMLGSFVRALLPPGTYVPGLGFILTLIVIFMFGLALNNLLTGNFLRAIEHRLMDIPFIKAVYAPLRDMMNLFSRDGKNELQKVVLVNLTDGRKALGVVTREVFDDVQLGGKADRMVAVFFPMSYGMGGFTFLVPRDQLQTVNIPVEKAMSLAITGWVKKEAAKEKEF